MSIRCRNPTGPREILQREILQLTIVSIRKVATMADTQTTYPNTVPLPPLSRASEVAELLVGAIDLHCHSGPAAMPRILDHHEELLDAAAAKFRAVLYKDHFYAGMPHAILLEKQFPECNVQLFSGIALNNA